MLESRIFAARISSPMMSSAAERVCAEEPLRERRAASIALRERYFSGPPRPERSRRLSARMWAGA